ncbi:hypothetical protein ACWFR5_13870 [Streptomyces sp. NPDC055092]
MVSLLLALTSDSTFLVSVLVVTIVVTTLCGKSYGAGWTGLVKEHATREHTIAEFFSVSRATVNRVLERTQGSTQTEAERR